MTLEESFYSSKELPCFLWSVRTSAAWNIYSMNFKRQGFEGGIPSKFPFLIHEFIHIYPLPHCLPCPWHYTKYQANNDDKTEIIPFLMDHRIYWERKNETNKYTIKFLYSKICRAYTQHRDFEPVVWNTLVQISTIVLSSSNSGHHSTITFSIKSSLTILYKSLKV